MRTRTLPFFLVGLTLLLPGRGRGQPPDEPTTPEEVVQAFLARAEAQEWNQLAELWTSESQALLDSVNAEVPFLIQAFLLLQATPGRPVQTGEPQVADGTAVVPLKKELALEFQVALRPEGRQWKIHLPATHLQPLGPSEQLEEVVQQFIALTQAGRWSDAVDLFDARSRQELQSEGRILQLREMALLAWATPEMKLELRRGNQTAEEAIVWLRKTATVEQTLVFRLEGGTWRLDFLNSLLASAGAWPEVLDQMRGRAQRIACLSNLKQLMLAMLLYAQDHDGTLPPAEGWTQALQPYLGNEAIWRCPSAPELACGYAMNAAWGGKKLGDLENPAQTVLLFDSTQGQANAHDQGESLPEPGRHQGGDNLGFADGHVQWAWAEEARRLLGLEGEPEAALPDPNGFEDYVAAGKLAVEREEALPEEADEAVLEAALKENTAALSRLREGFQKECRCPPVRSFNAPLPYLADFRKLARILRIEGRLAERQGNAAAAIDSYLDMLHLAQDTARGGVLIHRLVAVAIETMAYEAFSGLLERLDETAAEKLLQGLQARSDTAVPWAQTLAEEYRATRAGLLERGADDKIQQPLDLPPWGVDVPTVLDHLDRFYQQALQAAQKPYAERPAIEIPNDPICRQLIPALEKAGFRVALAETRARLTLAAAALHLYRLQHGQYPDGWEALIPAYLAQAPEDPFQAAPLIYRRVNEGYQLYSVGPDGDDDGGMALPRQNLELPADGDLVWGRF